MEPGEISQVYLWPDERRGPYLLRLTLRVVRDRHEVVGVELWGDAPSIWRTEVSGDRQDVDAVTWSTTARRRWEAAVSEPVPIRATTIRLPLERLAKDVLARFRRIASIIKSGRTPTLTTSSGERSGGRPLSAAARRAAEFIDHPGKSTRGRQPLYGEDHFQAVAKVYSEALARREPPTLAVANAKGVNKSTAAKWISRARQKSYLPPTAQGVPAGSRAGKSDSRHGKSRASKREEPPT